MTTVRQGFVANLHWAVVNKNQIHYSEGALRSEGEHKPFVLPLTADCSMFLADMASWAKSTVDPLGEHFNGTGYTGTEIAFDQEIPLAQAQPGDLVVYGPGTGWHTAGVVDVSNPHDPLTVSHGWEGAPEYVHVSQDGRLPQRYFRFLPLDPAPAPAAPKPVAALPPAKGAPAPGDLTVAKLEALKTPADAHTAHMNGYDLFYWSQGHNPPFCPQRGGQPTGCALYASVNWRMKK